jgi:hypothetical protein
MLRVNEPEYNVWRNIKQRCLNKNNPGYKNYGGRGIKICERWADSYENFLEDLGRRPSHLHQIDRINNEGDYTPHNVRWVLCRENLRNTRQTRYTEEFIRVWYRLVVDLEWTQEEVSNLFSVPAGRVSECLNGLAWVGVLDREELNRVRETSRRRTGWKTRKSWV